jgi:hypothetical protein
MRQHDAKKIIARTFCSTTVARVELDIVSDAAGIINESIRHAWSSGAFISNIYYHAI